MYKIVYDVDYSQLNDIVKYIELVLKQVSALKESVQVAGNFAIQQWINTANSKFKHSQGGYVRGIVSGINYPFNGDALHYRVIHADRYAKALEDGFDSYDMKKMLQTSEKVRISKDGKRYLIIPFRHGIPGTVGFRPMPKEIYDQAKGLRHSITEGTFREGSVRHAITMDDAQLLKSHNPKQVIRNTYSWGDRLKDVDWALEKAHHKSNIYEGMVRFQNNPNVNRARFDSGKFILSENKSTDFKGNYSSYFTFRIMHEDSTGWIHPGMKPMKILAETVERIKQPIMQMLAEGAKKDLGRVFNKPY
jgi:hypothetical protein